MNKEIDGLAKYVGDYTYEVRYGRKAESLEDHRTIKVKVWKVKDRRVRRVDGKNLMLMSMKMRMSIYLQWRN